jgi:hypothetical protein
MNLEFVQVYVEAVIAHTKFILLPGKDVRASFCRLEGSKETRLVTRTEFYMNLRRITSLELT